ncbi:hypothetical protein PENSPDRAFT_750753 [Peniophora sp. CONT]|nr:hypothetical protein PENSPDRAFT_750753 [Peniophora sp. CONT]
MPSLPLFGYSSDELTDVDQRAFTFLTLLLAVLYCVLFDAFFKAALSLTKDGLRSKTNKSYMCAISVMFAFTTTYVAFVVAELWMLLSDNVAEIYGIGILIESGVFAVNVILGDAIILWRALIIWGWYRPMVYISGILLLVNAALWLYTVIAVEIYVSPYVSIPASLATSLWATCAISLKAWQRRRMLRQNVAIVSRRSALENVLSILTESGVVFTLLWFIYLLSNINTGNNKSFHSIMTVVMIIAAPLYPIIIVIFVARHRTPLSDQLTSIEPHTVLGAGRGGLDVEYQDLLTDDHNGAGRKDIDVALQDM